MQYIQAPSGAYIPVRDGISYEEALAKARAAYPQDFGIKPKEGMGAEFNKGLEQLTSTGLTGLGALFGNAQQAAAQGAARSESIGNRYADQIGMDKVSERYNAPDGGLFAAAREVARQVPLAIAGQAPNIGATVGGGAIGRTIGAIAGAPFGGPVGSLVGGTIGGIAGAALPSWLQQVGGNVERQQEATPGQINVPNAALTAVPQAALDMLLHSSRSAER